MHTILSQIAATLPSENCVLATVISSTGSTPRSSGAHMLICSEKKYYGTVGGGLVEAKVQEAADIFLQGDVSGAALCSYILDNTQAGAIGMSCGGSLTVLLERFTPAQHTEFHELASRVSQGKKATRTAYYAEAGGEWHKFSLDEASTAEASSNHLQQLDNMLKSHTADAAPVLLSESPLHVFSETYTPPPTVIIAGAGHVAKPTAEIAHLTNFSVIVLDDRDEFANSERFPTAHVQVVESLDDILSNITVHEDCYVVIVTRGHEHDKTVLKQMLTTPARYIGMIGSKSKRDGLYDELRKEGVTDEAIARCHSPIGLPIGGRTPEEIGVSIMAEIIQARSQR